MFIKTSIKIKELNDFIFDGSLSMKDKGVMYYVLIFQKHIGVTKAFLVKKTRLSKPTINKIIKRLVAINLLRLVEDEDD